MRRFVVPALLIVVGVIHLLPLPGLLGAEALQRLYGIAIEKPDLLILMRHRALLFGLLGAFLVYAAFRPALQGLAIAAGAISVVGFLWLATEVGGYSAPLARVFWADVVALVALALAAGVRLWGGSRPAGPD